MSKAQEVMDAVAQHVIASIEAGVDSGRWQQPWVSTGGVPRNALTRKHYQGGNTIALWITQMVKEYTSSQWATYKQWTQLGAQVRKGEEATFGVKWTLKVCRDHGKDEACTKCGRMVPSVFFVFNACQVDGWDNNPDMAKHNPDSQVEEWDAVFRATGAVITHGDFQAAYSPTLDRITMPTFDAFRDGASYYSTLAHEVTHWTGHKDRVGRDLTGRFGDQSYAMEELVAELGSAMLCALLGVESVPRDDHAQYLAHWLGVLRQDSKALWTAAGAASKAVTYVQDLTRLGVEEAATA